MNDVRVVLAVIVLLRHLCWICFFAFMAQIAYRLAPYVAESVRPQFVTVFDSTLFDHTTGKWRKADQAKSSQPSPQERQLNHHGQDSHSISNESME